MYTFNSTGLGNLAKSPKENFDCVKIADDLMSGLDIFDHERQRAIVSCMASRVSGSIDSRIVYLNEERERIEMELKHLSALNKGKNG